MQNQDDMIEDDEPLDPEMEKVRRKMIRLLGISLGVMFIGVMAVLVSVVYKIRTSGDEDGEKNTAIVQSKTTLAEQAMTQFTDKIDLPADFAVLNMHLDGSRIAFYGLLSEGDDGDGVERLLIFDLSSGQMLANILAIQN